MIRAVANTRRAWFAVALLAAGVAAVGALAALLLLGGDGAEPGARPATATGSRYAEGVIGAWRRVNPLFAAGNAADEDLSRLVFAGLLRVDRDGRLLPDLAPLPQISDDGLTYTFRLHPDLRWHDGTPLRSLDVAFTIARIAAPDFRGPPRLAAAWSEVEVLTPDLRTVVLRLPAPHAPFLARYATIGILPQHLLQGLDGAELFDAPFNARPVGAGPYRLEALTTLDATLRAWPRYHLGRPGIETVVLRFLPDFPAALAALEEGGIDGILLRRAPDAAQAAALDRLAGFARADPQRSASFTLYLNNAQAEHFRDPRVRTAISLAIDRAALAQATLRGLATPSASAVAPGVWAYAPALDGLGADRERAAALLAEAGWTRSPTTGALERDGAEFRFTIRTDDDPLHVALALAVAGQLEPLGIRAAVASTSFTVLRRDFLDARGYDAALTAWDQGPDPDPYDAWHSSRARPPGGNVASYGGLVIDALLERGRVTLDPLVRLDAYAQFQELWRREAPSVVLAYPRLRYLRAERVEAPAPGVLFSPADRFLDIHRWRIA